jgi:hypothetical protein
MSGNIISILRFAQIELELLNLSNSETIPDVLVGMKHDSASREGTLPDCV